MDASVLELTVVCFQMHTASYSTVIGIPSYIILKYTLSQLDYAVELSLRNKKCVTFWLDFSFVWQFPIADTYSIAYARTFLTRFSQSLLTPSFPGFNMLGVFSRLGLPSFKQPRFCVGGLVSFLNTAGISQDVFIDGISRNSGSILGRIRKYKVKFGQCITCELALKWVRWNEANIQNYATVQYLLY